MLARPMLLRPGLRANSRPSLATRQATGAGGSLSRSLEAGRSGGSRTRRSRPSPGGFVVWQTGHSCEDGHLGAIRHILREDDGGLAGGRFCHRAADYGALFRLCSWSPVPARPRWRQVVKGETASTVLRAGCGELDQKTGRACESGPLRHLPARITPRNDHVASKGRARGERVTLCAFPAPGRGWFPSASSRPPCWYRPGG